MLFDAKQIAIFLSESRYATPCPSLHLRFAPSAEPRSLETGFGDFASTENCRAGGAPSHTTPTNAVESTGAASLRFLKGADLTAALSTTAEKYIPKNIISALASGFWRFCDIRGSVLLPSSQRHDPRALHGCRSIARRLLN